MLGRPRRQLFELTFSKGGENFYVNFVREGILRREIKKYEKTMM